MQRYNITVKSPGGEILHDGTHQFESHDQAESYAQYIAAAYDMQYGNCSWSVS
ncbi:MAG: hypothetical protein KME45_23190 [Stenomitos rutilans HA7619-LM2]|jgi:hypothetical protein|nr:hypothetical protein [Stenomitos rutilans HA7619-LM2]